MPPLDDATLDALEKARDAERLREAMAATHGELMALSEKFTHERPITAFAIADLARKLRERAALKGEADAT
jgi:hypothetical protein